MQDAVVYVLTSPLEALSNSSPLTLVMVVAIILFGALFSLVAVVLMSRPFPAPKGGMVIEGKAEGGKEDEYTYPEEDLDGIPEFPEFPERDETDPITILDSRLATVIDKFQGPGNECVVRIQIPGMKAVYNDVVSIKDEETHRVYACKPFSFPSCSQSPELEKFGERGERGERGLGKGEKGKKKKGIGGLGGLGKKNSRGKLCDIGSVISEHATLSGELEVETLPDLWNNLDVDSSVLINMCLSEWIVTKEIQDPWGRPKLVDIIDRSYDLMLEIPSPEIFQEKNTQNVVEGEVLE
jgi:hypothetical protein